MTTRSEPAGLWVRVSWGGQDEQNQVPDVERYCDSHGYQIKRRYELNDKSASKGEQQSTLDQMIDDMRDETIRVLVCWHSNRLDRRGPEAVFSLLSDVRKANGRIESVQEPEFGKQSFAGQLVTATNAAVAYEKSQNLAASIGLSHKRIAGNTGVGPGGAPWGYVAVGPKYDKRLVATDECRKYVPQIFARAIAGESYRSIAEWLDTEGVKPMRAAKWYDGSVRKLLRRKVYAGFWNWTLGDKVMTTESEAVISLTTWDRANKATSRQPIRKPQTHGYLGSVRCARCEDSPMGIIRNKGRDGTIVYAYYRCKGRGANRKGCGNMIRAEVLDQIVHMWTVINGDAPYCQRKWVDAEDYHDDIRYLTECMHSAVDAREFDKLPALQVQIDDLLSKQEHAEAGHWEYLETSETIGEHFHNMTYDEQRDELMTHDIRAEKVPDRDGVPGVHLLIAGEDYGVIRLAA